VSETIVLEPVAEDRAASLLSVRIGWRNLWRNRRRTWLTTGGIAFSVLLVMFFMSMQFGQYAIMIDSATSLMAGQVQVQSSRYLQDSRFEDTIVEATPLIRLLQENRHIVSVAPRVEAFALVSADERSFGAQILGIDQAAELETVRYVKMLKTGSNLAGPDDAVLGSVLARNLGVAPGDEVVVLGSGKEGGIAALVLTVVGLLETGMADLDRSLLLAPLRMDDLSSSDRVVTQLTEQLPDALTVRAWQEILPELKQAIAVDKIGGQIMYWIIMVLVMFSVVNSFIMTVFERTREFGMMLAIGMRPRAIVAMLQWEALFLWVIGTAIGAGLASLLIIWLHDVGIYMGEQMEDYAKQFYMPARLYPGFSREVLTVAPLAMLVGTQVAALIPSLRIRRLRPIVALRTT
jgi:ABC-type lipoprotein release transport system permease subunit